MFNKLLTSSLSYIKCRGVKTLNMDMDTIGDDLTYPPRNPLNKMINYFKTINLSIHEFESFQLHTLALIQFPTNGILVPALVVVLLLVLLLHAIDIFQQIVHVVH